MLGGIVLTVVTTESALKFLKNNGSWIGVFHLFICSRFLVYGVEKNEKIKSNFLIK